MLEYFVPTDNFYVFLGYVSANIAEKITGTFLINSNRRLSGGKRTCTTFQKYSSIKANQRYIEKTLQ